jgi:hypothetical protein
MSARPLFQRLESAPGAVRRDLLQARFGGSLHLTPLGLEVRAIPLEEQGK